MVNLSKRWLIHLRGGYSRPVPTSVGRTLSNIMRYQVGVVLLVTGGRL